MPAQLTDLLNAAPWWLVVIVKAVIVLVIVQTVFAYSMLFERKIMAWMQLRPGPNRVGPWGLMQPAADAAKMLFKEDLTPATADPVIYKLAPFISSGWRSVSVLIGWAGIVFAAGPEAPAILQAQCSKIVTRPVA